MPPVNKDRFIYWTSEQFVRTKEIAYRAGMLIDAASDTYPADDIKGAEYTEIDESGIPWVAVVSIDYDIYKKSELSERMGFTYGMLGRQTTWHNTGFLRCIW